MSEPSDRERWSERVFTSYSFGVLDRDFRATHDAAWMGEDWRGWIVEELRRCERVLIADGDGFLGFDAEPTWFEVDGGPVTPAGQPLVRLAFLEVDDLEAVFAARGLAGRVQREHPWYRTARYRGYVILESLHWPIDAVYSDATEYARILGDRCLGRIIAPEGERVVDPLRARRFPLADLLKMFGGFRDAGVYRRGDDQDSVRFFAPIVDRINEALTGLGVGTRALASEMGPGTPDGWTPIGFPRYREPAVVDLAGRPIQHPERLLAGATVEIWELKLDPFEIAAGSRPEPDADERELARHITWRERWRRFFDVDWLGVVWMGLVLVGLAVFLYVDRCRS